MICGHSHTQDGEALHAALGKDAAYVGMLGSPGERSRRCLSGCAASASRRRSWTRSARPSASISAARRPEELAIAILAQILLVKNRGRQALTDAKEDKA